jgi:serine/threonine protein kinase
MALETGSTDLSGAPLPLPEIPDHKLLRRIGRGSYGEVWLTRNVVGTHRAVKVVYRKSFERDRPYDREFAGIQKFEPISRSHEGFVDILQIGRNDAEGYFYYVMELADAADDSSRNAEGESQEPKVGSASAGAESQVPETRISEEPKIRNGTCQTTKGIEPEVYVSRTLQHDLETRGRLSFAECLDISQPTKSAPMTRCT